MAIGLIVSDKVPIHVTVCARCLTLSQIRCGELIIYGHQRVQNNAFCFNMDIDLIEKSFSKAT